MVPLPAGLSWTFLVTPLGPIGLAASPRGVCRVLLNAPSRWVRAAYPNERASHVFPHAFPGGKAIVAYLNGASEDLTKVPVDPTGTPFQMAVWQAVCDIPAGQSLTYGEVAQIVGRPGGAQAVGQALSKNPVPLLIPCHRVLAANEGLGGFTGGLDLKRFLLTLEQTPYKDHHHV